MIVEVCVPVTVDCGIGLSVGVRVEEIEERVSGIQLLLCHCCLAENAARLAADINITDFAKRGDYVCQFGD